MTQSPLTFDMDTKLSDLKLQWYILAELGQLGYEVVRDMQHLSAADILRIPGMAGRDWRVIAAALGIEGAPRRKKRG